MYRIRNAVVVTLMAALVGVVALGEPSSAAAATKPSPFACGFQTFKKADGSRYACSFADDFSGTTLNSNKWMVQTSDGLSGFKAGGTCYLDSSDSVFVRGGYLNLVGKVSDSAFDCKTPYETFKTTYTGGTVTSWEKFSQAYGRFSFRARFPSTSQPGYYGNLWLYPQTHTYGLWPRSGEIDVAEQWSGYLDRVYPSLHYSGRTTDDTAFDCKVRNVGTFHTYTLEWSRTQMKFFYDSSLCFTRSWSPQAPLVAPEPFDQPFTLVMSQGLGPDGYNTIMSTLPKADRMQVDWVRVWN